MSFKAKIKKRDKELKKVTKARDQLISNCIKSLTSSASAAVQCHPDQIWEIAKTQTVAGKIILSLMTGTQQQISEINRAYQKSCESINQKCGIKEVKAVITGFSKSENECIAQDYSYYMIDDEPVFINEQ